MFADADIWKNVHDRDRRDLYEDIVHQLAKKERVRQSVVSFTALQNFFKLLFKWVYNSTVNHGHCLPRLVTVDHIRSHMASQSLTS